MGVSHCVSGTWKTCTGFNTILLLTNFITFIYLTRFLCFFLIENLHHATYKNAEPHRLYAPQWRSRLRKTNYKRTFALQNANRLFFYFFIFIIFLFFYYDIIHQIKQHVYKRNAYADRRPAPEPKPETVLEPVTLKN